MHYGFDFLQDRYFYFLLLIGALALLPRARYTAQRAAALTADAAAQITPNLAERICVFFPGLGVFACVALLQYVTGAAILLAVFLLLYVVMIMGFKRAIG
ncbi:MAG: hypothetical protein AAGG38_13680 [Planctomycetota bacterium]